MLAGTRTTLPELFSIAGSSLKQNASRRLATAAEPASSSTSSLLGLHGRTRNSTPLKTITTPEKASEYLSALLSLPPSRQFPPTLALRILTHKSYRGAHVLGQGYSSRTSSTNDSVPETERFGSAPHNGRLTFLGKRAFLSYLLMFIHEHATTKASREGLPFGTELEGLSILDKDGAQVDLQTKVENLVNLSNLGRSVGSKWGLEHVMRWQSNLTGEGANARDSGALKIQGEGVQAVLGGTMMQFGSPAAQRLFHTQILPILAPQFRDPALIEAIHEARATILKQMSGEACVLP